MAGDLGKGEKTTPHDNRVIALCASLASRCQRREPSLSFQSHICKRHSLAQEGPGGWDFFPVCGRRWLTPASPGRRSRERLFILLDKAGGPLSMPTLCWEAPCCSESGPTCPLGTSPPPPSELALGPPSALTAAQELGWPPSHHSAGAQVSPCSCLLCPSPAGSRKGLMQAGHVGGELSAPREKSASGVPAAVAMAQRRRPVEACRWGSGPDRPLPTS